MSREHPRPPGRKGKSERTVALPEFIEVAGGPRLDLPREPVELRDGLRDVLLAGGDWGEGLSDDHDIALWLWRQWQSVLEPAGFGQDELAEVVMATRRELWLWLLGDRIWNQYVAGLAGRVLRRLPQPSVT